MNIVDHESNTSCFSQDMLALHDVYIAMTENQFSVRPLYLHLSYRPTVTL